MKDQKKVTAVFRILVIRNIWQKIQKLVKEIFLQIKLIVNIKVQRIAQILQRMKQYGSHICNVVICRCMFRQYMPLKPEKYCIKF